MARLRRCHSFLLDRLATVIRKQQEVRCHLVFFRLLVMTTYEFDARDLKQVLFLWYWLLVVLEFDKFIVGILRILTHFAHFDVRSLFCLFTSLLWASTLTRICLIIVKAELRNVCAQVVDLAVLVSIPFLKRAPRWRKGLNVNLLLRFNYVLIIIWSLPSMMRFDLDWLVRGVVESRLWWSSRSSIRSYLPFDRLASAWKT